jgi:hypothetical protein
MAMDGRYAGNAGAISGRPWMAGMPEMQEQFPAWPWMARMPEMQEQFPAWPWMAGMPEMQEHYRQIIFATDPRASICRFSPPLQGEGWVGMVLTLRASNHRRHKPAARPP